MESQHDKRRFPSARRFLRQVQEKGRINGYAIKWLSQRQTDSC